jgi:hypothetical protein
MSYVSADEAGQKKIETWIIAAAELISEGALPQVVVPTDYRWRRMPSRLDTEEEDDPVWTDV